MFKYKGANNKTSKKTPQTVASQGAMFLRLFRPFMTPKWSSEVAPAAFFSGGAGGVKFLNFWF